MKKQKTSAILLKNTITLNNKKYDYFLKDNKDGTIFFECEDAKISQDFLAEDIAGVIIDLPKLILAEKEYSKKASEVIQFRVSPADRSKIEKKALKEGFDSVSSYLRENLLSI
ncbi:MAG: hypothetical protein KAI16_01660 [Candidatus Pacebacteria bacterium]|nr:hypothetical protein [Candidatus Paceibacterota bacterium]